MPDLIYEKECYEIVGACMEVHNVLGQGFLEPVYQDALAVELKALDSLTSNHEAQVLNYLKATGYKMGLLVNFGSDRLTYKRLVM